MSRTASTRSAPLSRLTKRLPKPDEPRTLGANTPMPCAQQRLVVAAEGRPLLAFGAAVEAEDVAARGPFAPLGR